VSHPGAASRFEIETRQHHHLLCIHCGKMTDLVDSSLDSIAFPNVRVKGFEFTDYSIQFRGVCSNCSRKRGRRV
jgi:Fe2+ or Zn2+ uptake regulation protein